MKKRPLCLVCIGLMILIFLMKTAGFPVFGEPGRMSEICAAAGSEDPVHVTGKIYRREKTANAVRYYLKHTFLSFHNQQIPLNKIYVMTQLEGPWPVGAQVCVEGSLERPELPGNPGQFNAREYYACQKIYFCMWGETIRTLRAPETWLAEDMTVLREKLTESTARLLPNRAAGVLAAMLWGDKTLLEEETEINYRFGGVMHVLSISGLHVSLMGLGVYGLLRRIFPWKGVSAAASVGLMLLYSLFAGAQVATIRAFLMFAVGIGARLTGRSYDLPCALSLSAILLLLENPGYLFQSGFQLSFTAVLGVGVVCPAFLSLLPERKEKNRSLKGLAEKLGRDAYSCMVIWAVTLPLSAYYFYELPLWGTVLNLLMLPVMGSVMALGGAGCVLGLLSPVGGKLLLALPGALLSVFEKLMEALRFLPGGLLICGQPRLWRLAVFYAGLAVLVYRIRRPRKEEKKRKTGKAAALWISALALLCVSLFLKPAPEFSLTALDVGQGDCLVLRTETGCFLVDGGSSSEKQVGTYRILPYLKQQGIGRLDGIFLTHPDQDHVNGIQEILQASAERETQLRIGKLLLPAWMQGTEGEKELICLAEKAGTPVRYLKAGDRIRSGSCGITVLYPGPDKKAAEGEENAASLVLSVHCGSFDGLLTGDLEGEGERALLESVGRYDYLKVAHHGSRSSTGEEFLAAVRPEICVISAPEDSVYGHPHPEVLERIQNAGGTVFCTADCGAVRVEVGQGKITVFTFASEYGIL